MAMNGLVAVLKALESLNSTSAIKPYEIEVDPALGIRAKQPIDRMLAFTQSLLPSTVINQLVPNMGAA
jgi:quinolinate synthase